MAAKKAIPVTEIKICKGCNTEFLPRTYGEVQNFCTTDCRNRYCGNKVGHFKKTKVPRLTLKCKNCDNTFKLTPGVAAQKGRVFCSKNCKTAYFGLHIKQFACKRCGATFTQTCNKEGKNASGKIPKFCCAECSSLFLSENSVRKNTWTSIEIAVAQVFDNWSLKYLHQAKIQDRGWISDFYLPVQDIYVECNGDYWHCNPRVYPNGATTKFQKRKIQRDKDLSDLLGPKLITVWELDINQLGAEKALINAGLSKVSYANY